MTKDRISYLRRYFRWSPETETNEILIETLPVIQECIDEVKRLQEESAAKFSKDDLIAVVEEFKWHSRGGDSGADVVERWLEERKESS